MGILLLTGILGAILLVVGILIYCKTYCEGCGVGFTVAGITSLVAFIICICIVLAKPLSVESNLADYHALKTTVQNARENNNVSEYEKATILQDIIENNKIIEENKRLSDNFWVGVFYSKTLGELDYILIE